MVGPLHTGRYAIGGAANDVDDPVLAREGIRIGRDASPPDDPTIFAVVRLGLSLRILDRVTAHLAPRTVGGQKTLRQQSVMDTASHHLLHFSSIANLFDWDLPWRDTRLPAERLGYVNREISEGVAGISTLMGGHGYLVHGTSPLNYLCTLLENLA